jgi:hypothetical protein
MSQSATTPAAQRVVVRDLERKEHDEWRAIVSGSPHGSVYALPEYLDALSRATDAAFRIVGVFFDGRLVGGVPLYERRSRSGAYVTNRLLLYYNGIVLKLPPKKFHSDQTAQEQQVLTALASELEGRRYAHVLLHNRSTVLDLRPFLTRGWQESLSYTYVLPLSNPTEQWERIDQNLRRLIQRCEREGVTYREDDDFDALFRLHLKTHQRKGAPLYLPETAFRAFFNDVRAAGLARLGHAVFDGKVIASQLMLAGPHPVAHTVCAGTDDDHLRMGASGFLRWHASLSLARDGFVANDLTDAGLNPVTRFKSQFGAELTPTWTVSRSDSLIFRLESAVQRWRSDVTRRRPKPREAS